MKKLTRQKINELAKYFDNELEMYLPVLVLPDGSLFHKNYIIKLLNNKNWGLFNSKNGDLIEQYFMKSCALIAANAYANIDLSKFNLTKQLDSQYWSNYFDISVYEKNIKSEKDYEKYLILLDKLENSIVGAQVYKDKIAKSFKHTFT